MHELIEDVELSFKLFEFALRTMCYAELGKIDADLFGQDLQLNLPHENVGFSGGVFQNENEIVKVSQMAVGAAFGSTAICLDCLLEKNESENPKVVTIKSLISAVRNAFSHSIAAPNWYVKPHKYGQLDLSFIAGPVVNLEQLNSSVFDYSQIGGLAVWYRAKEFIIAHT